MTVTLGTRLGMVQLDGVLYGVVRTLLPSIFNCQDANAAEPLLACFQVLLSPLCATQYHASCYVRLGVLQANDRLVQCLVCMCSGWQQSNNIGKPSMLFWLSACSVGCCCQPELLPRCHQLVPLLL